jgi:hypothetical protein
MKKALTLIITAILVVKIGISISFANTSVSETNLDGLSIYVNENVTPEFPQSIDYADGSKEIFTGQMIGLFVNGSIVKDANIVIENNRTLVPLRLISETLGAVVDWDSSVSKATITDGSNKIELTIGDKKPKINGNVISIDVAPIIIDDRTYVPLRFIAESLGCKADWFDGTAVQNGDGTGVPEAHYALRMPQVMISRYPVDAKTMTKSEAIEKVKAQLIIAYEKRFGVKYNPLVAAPKQYEEQSSWRYTISNLSVTSENDRFYTIHVLWDFMVDKYTGSIIVYYNGDLQMFYKFDPESPGALAFAG